MIQAQTFRKVLLLSAVAIFASSSAIAQHGGGGSAPPQPPNQQQQTGAVSNDSMSPQAIADRDFLKKALVGGDVEVQLGQLAQQKSQSDDVKEFAQKMVQDHTQMGDQLIKPLAKQLGVDAPKNLPKKDKQFIAKLEALSGPQFDEEYIKAMVKDHTQVLKDFKSEEAATQDSAVKQAVQQAVPVISAHLELIEKIAQSHNVTADAK